MIEALTPTRGCLVLGAELPPHHPAGAALPVLRSDEVSEQGGTALTLVRFTDELEIALLHGQRNILPEDARLLGGLMSAAYPEPGSLASEILRYAEMEAESILAEQCWPVIWDCSLVVIRERRLIASSLVIDHDGTPLLAYVMTHPGCRREGIALQLVRESISALYRLGIDQLKLWVTPSNFPAIELYNRLGFHAGSDCHAARGL